MAGNMRTEVEALMAAWQNAWFTKDRSVISRLMSDDYVYIAPNGAIMDRAAILDVVGDTTYGLTGGAHTETVITMLGDCAAVVRRHWQGTGRYRGQVFVEDHRYVTICDRSSGQWHIRYEQCSAVAA